VGLKSASLEVVVFKQGNDGTHRKDLPALMSRRAAVIGTAGVPLWLPLSAHPAAADDAIAGLVKGAEEKNAAFMRGDMNRWAKLTRIAPDFTLMQPFGGPASHGFDASPRRLAELAQYFRNGKTKLEVVQTYASDRMVVLVMVERQSAEVGGLPDQDWSLRVTEVYRRDGSDWQLAHRHADPLVHRFTLEQAAALARGQS
jgi:ketosteroid isomerase-like protein